MGMLPCDLMGNTIHILESVIHAGVLCQTPDQSKSDDMGEGHLRTGPCQLVFIDDLAIFLQQTNRNTANRRRCGNVRTLLHVLGDLASDSLEGFENRIRRLGDNWLRGDRLLRR